MLPEARNQSGCAQCATARCCIATRQSLTGADLLRLVRQFYGGEAARAVDLVDFVPVRADQIGADGVALDDTGGLYELTLKKRPDGACQLLMSFPSGDRRCGAYAARPMVCRLFPTERTSLGVMVLTPEAICPPNAWSIARTDLATTATLHDRAEVERARFRAFLRAWPTPTSGTQAAREFLSALLADAESS